MFLDFLLENLLIHAKHWRIRLSPEAKRYIYASSLLASTKVDSVELDQARSANPQHANNHHLHAQLDLNITNIECRLTTSDLTPADLLTLNLTNFGLRLLLSDYESNRAASTAISLSTYGQLAVDHCEYKFLTMRPLLDSFSFNASLFTESAGHAVNARIHANSVNVSVSQSALASLNHLTTEWSEINNSKSVIMPSFYRIFNQTSMPLNLKQFDTEETCLLKPGACLPYTWRSHKKAQLMQVFAAKHQASSQAFQVDRLGYQLVRLRSNYTGQACISLIVRVLVSTETAYYERDVFVQAQLVVCNYLSGCVEGVEVGYVSEGIGYVVGGEQVMVGALSRSELTFEVVENEGESMAVTSVRVNRSVEVGLRQFGSQEEFDEQLKRGMLN